MNDAINEAIDWFNKGRGLLIFKRDDQRVSVLLKENERLRLFILEAGDLIDIFLKVFEKHGTIPGIYFTPFGTVYVLTREQIRSFVRLASGYEQ